jgi:hypothetical protein
MPDSSVIRSMDAIWPGPCVYGQDRRRGGRALTQQAVERALGKLLTDEAFRRRFFAAPEAACWEAGLLISPEELEAMAKLSRDDLARVADGLDRRISRPCLDPEWQAATSDATE